jgi:hypothetical protein
VESIDKMQQSPLARKKLRREIDSETRGIDKDRHLCEGSNQVPDLQDPVVTIYTPPLHA